MTKKTAKPKTAQDWEKVCGQLNDVIHAQHAEEQRLEKVLEDLSAQIEEYKEQVTMFRGIVKYLETKIV